MRHAIPAADPRRARGFAPGFTLLEVAIALLVLTLLLGSLAPPLAARWEQQRWRQTQDQLQEIRGALLAYAVLHGRLPCPSREPNPASAAYGLEDCAAPETAEGYLPWRALGVRETDPWGAPRRRGNAPWHGYWRYRADRRFTTPLSLDSAVSSGGIAVTDAAGRRLSASTLPPAAFVYSTGPNRRPDGHNASYEAGNAARYQAGDPAAGFDDIAIWISQPVLFDRLLQAGRIP